MMLAGQDVAGQRFLDRRREQDLCRRVGRPFRNPFRYPEVEQDFYRRAAEVVRLCYRPSSESDKKPFLVNGIPMGKTAFWAFIYYFYVKVEVQPAERDFCPLFPDLQRPLLEENLDHFLMLLRGHVPQECVGDRPAISKKVKKLCGMSLGFVREVEGMSHITNELRKYRSIYQEVLRLWFAS